ncbi:MAG: cysteine desulfurase [bacterium]|nr:cysteine desulfurase [bacterium]
MYDVYKIRNDFPILKEKINGKKLVYLDNAATTQKPLSVINATSDYYKHYNANVHRGVYTLGAIATQEYERIRKKVADFIGAEESSCIVFTKGTTEAINLVAYGWGRKFLRDGDEVILTIMEHHSNIVPWQILARERGIKLKFIPLRDDGTLDMDSFYSSISEDTKLISITYVSNVLGTINPIGEIVKIAHNIRAKVLIDGAQGIPSIPTNVKNLDVDFLAFSAHKMLGPTGIGILYSKREILEEMEPLLGGGEMIKRVSIFDSIWADIPYRFEGGTPNIAGVIGFGEAIDYLNNLGMDEVFKHEKILTAYALEMLSSLDGITIYGPKDINLRSSIISFNYKKVHPHDVATILDQNGIAIRAGHHCAQPLHDALGISASCRVSLYVYNTKEEIDCLIKSLEKVEKIFSYGT